MLKKISQAVITLLLALALAFGATATVQPTQAHAATSQTVIDSTTSPVLSQTLIAKANPYIHLYNHTASVDPTISQALTTEEITVVQQAVDQYNTLPTSQKVNTQASLASTNTALATASCTSEITSYSYWWGYAYTLNHCIISQLYVLAEAGNVAGAIAIICGFISLGTCALVEGAIGLALNAYVSALQGADAQCNNEGANLNIPFTGTAFVNTVC